LSLVHNPNLLFTAPFYRLAVDLLPNSLNDNSTALSFIEVVKRSVLARHRTILPIGCLNSTNKFGESLDKGPCLRHAGAGCALLFNQFDDLVEVVRGFYGGITELALIFLMVVDGYVGVF
jgi:hypothetical protein